MQGLVGSDVALPGHFVGRVTVEHVRPLGTGAELRVRLPNGELDETVLSADDLAHLQFNGDGGRPYEMREGPPTVQPGEPDAETPKPTGTAVSLRGISFKADSAALFDAWNAVANLAGLAGKVTVSVSVDESAELDRQKLENGVLEPLRELGLIDDEPIG